MKFIKLLFLIGSLIFCILQELVNLILCLFGLSGIECQKLHFFILLLIKRNVIKRFKSLILT